MRTAAIGRMCGFDGLTTREREVARHISAGKSNRDIAALLDISHRTVEHHVAAIFSKLGVDSRLQIALRFVIEQHRL
jgi:DNA-binding NarL/FixJ family response regulator